MVQVHLPDPFKKMNNKLQKATLSEVNKMYNKNSNLWALMKYRDELMDNVIASSTLFVIMCPLLIFVIIPILLGALTSTSLYRRTKI